MIHLKLDRWNYQQTRKFTILNITDTLCDITYTHILTFTFVTLDPHNGHKLVKEVSEEVLPELLVQVGIEEDVLVVVNDLVGGSLKKLAKLLLNRRSSLKGTEELLLTKSRRRYANTS